MGLTIRRERFVNVGFAAASTAATRRIGAGRAFAVRPQAHVARPGAALTFVRDLVVRLTPQAGGWRMDCRPSDFGPFPRLQGIVTMQDTGGATRVRLFAAYDALAPEGLAYRLLYATAGAILDVIASACHMPEPPP